MVTRSAVQASHVHAVVVLDHLDIRFHGFKPCSTALGSLNEPSLQRIVFQLKQVRQFGLGLTKPSVRQRNVIVERTPFANGARPRAASCL